MIIILTDCHNSNMVMLNEIVINGSKHTGNTMFGGNLHLMMFSVLQENTLRKHTNILIANSIFLNGIGLCSPRPTEFECSSGGLTFLLTQENFPGITIVINRCKFINNKAQSGGGVKLSGQLRQNTRIHIKESIFSRNTAILNGGGIAMVINNFRSSLKISESVFSYNTAEFNGGATYTSLRTHFSYDKCTFIGNEARFGAAVYSNQCYPAITNCTFKHNTCRINTALTDMEIDETGTIDVREGISLLIENVKITNNDCRGIYLYETGLNLFGKSLLKGNHARQSDGGAILFDCLVSFTTFAVFYTESNATLSIINNTADGYGGGVAIRRNCGGTGICFFKIEPPTNKITISMKHNLATKGGDAIYGGDLEYCNLWDILDITERNTSSAVSSLPYQVCICSDDFPQKHTCSHSMQLHAYPGQRFQVPLVCVGQYNYSSPCKLQAHLEIISIGSIADEAHLQKIATECKQLYYSIETQHTNYTERLSLTIVKEQDSNYLWKSQTISTVIEIIIKVCPPGFTQNNNDRKCICTDYLTSKGITCNIDEERLYKTSSMWVGNYSGDVLVHQVCPFDYCKSNFTRVNPFNQQDQCDFNRSDVPCGACRPGLSLVLGTSLCKECSNIYLLLLIPFALAGVVLVVLLLKCNLIVSTGTINGLIFYANIVQATQTAFFPVATDNKFVSILFVFVAWLNFDLGIETCFVNKLNTYYRTWLQFIFPLYIWTIVGLLILISRYSIKVSKWTGSNTVSVLATLFLLSYAKLLRTTFNTFSSTALTDVNGMPTSLWLLDGQYTFLEWPHSMLFTAGLVILLVHILPFTVLLLTAPVL